MSPVISVLENKTLCTDIDKYGLFPHPIAEELSDLTTNPYSYGESVAPELII